MVPMPVHIGWCPSAPQQPDTNLVQKSAAQFPGEDLYSPSSPDLNPMVYSIYDIMSGEVEDVHQTSTNDFKTSAI